ncbi:MAG: NADP oxidoreductase, partial [Solirubrobacterales bacterium]
DTGERETIECGLVLRSIGYAGIGLEGVPFDPRRGVIPNRAGRVTELESDRQAEGHYAVGWIKRGPSGVIGTNKKDAQETVDALIEDARAGRVPSPELAADRAAIVELLAERVPDVVGFQGWEGIDRVERERGEPLGRPRVKFVRIDEMLEAARAAEPVSG